MKNLSAPNLTALDFPALTVPESPNGPSKYTGEDLQQNGNPYRSSDKDNLLLFKSNASFPSRSPVDFASAVRKLASQDSGIWKYDRNGSVDSSVGSSRSSHVLASPHSSGHGRGIYANRLQNRGSARAPPVWLETGDAVGNILQLPKLLEFVIILTVGQVHSACIYALTLLRWQQIYILRCGKMLVIMHVYGMHTLNRYMLKLVTLRTVLSFHSVVILYGTLPLPFLVAGNI